MLPAAEPAFPSSIFLRLLCITFARFGFCGGRCRRRSLASHLIVSNRAQDPSEATLVSSPAFNLHSSSPPRSAVSPSPFPATSNIFLATSRGRICGALSADAAAAAVARAEGGHTDDTFPCFAHRSFSIRPLMLTPSPPSLLSPLTDGMTSI